LSGVVLGLLIAFAVKAPIWVAAVIVGIFAIFHGHAHGTELPEAFSPYGYAVGFVIGTGSAAPRGHRPWRADAIRDGALCRARGGWRHRIGGSGIPVRRRLKVRRSLLTLWLGVCAGPVHAHAFDAGADAYGQFVEGAAVILIYPGILLPLLALGLLLSLWREDGLPTVWPVFLAAQVAGVFARGAGGAGCRACVHGPRASSPPRLPHSGRLYRRRLRWGWRGWRVYCRDDDGVRGAWIVRVAGLHASGPVLRGEPCHGAGGGCLQPRARRGSSAGWMRIGWRVVASWIGAILMLTLAFEVTGALS
jgi:hydrogenase/urease accessory protein HupE